jgi:pyridoxine kinase
MAGRTVLVISSHVARGSVGNRAMTFALERLGFTAWAVPTVLLPHHPGHGAAIQIVTEEGRFESFLQGVVEGAAPLAGVISGYLASPAQAQAVAAVVARLKVEQPDLVYLCDPVFGDAGRLYVEEALADAIRDQLLPLADIATPNLFECGWLAGEPETDGSDLTALAQRLGPPMVLVTSAPALMRGRIGNLLVDRSGAFLAEHPMLQTPVKGTGDLLAALFLARRLQGSEPAKALELAASSTFEVLAGTARAGGDELMLPELQHALVQPRSPVNLRRIAVRS